MIFDANQAQELKSVLVESVKINQNTGSSTCVLAKFDT
jgi:protein phosphatase PTC7